MRTDDIKKLTEAGFTIFRAQDYPEPMILYYAKDQWERLNHIAEPFKTVNERDEILEEIHKFGNVILD